MVSSKATPAKASTKPASSNKSVKPKSSAKPAADVPPADTDYTTITVETASDNTNTVPDATTLVPAGTTQTGATPTDNTVAVPTDSAVVPKPVKKSVKSTDNSKVAKLKKTVKIKEAEQPPPVSMDVVNHTLNNSTVTEQLQAQLTQIRDQIHSETLAFNENQYTVQQLKQQIELYNTNKQQLQSDYNIKDVEYQRVQSQCYSERQLYSSKIRYLMSENVNDIIDTKLAHIHTVQSHMQQYHEQRSEYKHDSAVLQAAQKQLQYEYLQLQHSTNATHEQQVQQLRVEYESKLEQERYVYEYGCKQVRERAEQCSKAEIDELEARKQADVERLVLQHKQQFEALQKYFHDIQQCNIELIKSLKSELKECKRREGTQGRLLGEVQKRASEISKPLHTNQHTVDTLNRQLQQYDTERAELATVNTQIAELVQQNKSCEWQYEILIQKHTQLQAELQALKQQYTHTVYDVKQKIDFTTLVLNKKYRALQVDMEKTNVALVELLQNCGLSSDSLSNAKLSLDYILNIKNKQINECELQLEALKRQFASRVEQYRAVCKQNNLSEEVLGLNQLPIAG